MVVGKSSGVFGKVKKASENDRKSSEDAGTFSKITGDHSEAKISRIWPRLLLHLSEELLTVEPARGTSYETIL